MTGTAGALGVGVGAVTGAGLVRGVLLGLAGSGVAGGSLAGDADGARLAAALATGSAGGAGSHD